MASLQCTCDVLSLLQLILLVRVATCPGGYLPGWLLARVAICPGGYLPGWLLARVFVYDNRRERERERETMRSIGLLMNSQNWLLLLPNSKVFCSGTSTQDCN